MKSSIAALLVALACAGCATSGSQATLGQNEFSKIVAGKTTASEVRSLLGTPARSLPQRGEKGETWMYIYRGDFERRMFWVELSADGLVRSTEDTRDLDAAPFRRG